MNATIEAVGLIAEVWTTDPHYGPAPDGFVEVTLAEVTDHGGNVLGRAKTPAGVQRIRNRYRIPTKLRAVKFGKRMADAAYLMDYTTICGAVSVDELTTS